MGNSLDNSLPPLLAAVHPHACGELSYFFCFLKDCSGSSPRLWGTQESSKHCTMQIRFIPTLVGNSISKSFISFNPSVHPHACGELSIRGALWEFGDGSSPRLWGTHDDPSAVRFESRFIPTLVGNSCRYHPKTSYTAVHPHACGELFFYFLYYLFSTGSSPRLWGTQRRL